MLQGGQFNQYVHHWFIAALKVHPSMGGIVDHLQGITLSSKNTEGKGRLQYDHPP